MPRALAADRRRLLALAFVAAWTAAGRAADTPAGRAEAVVGDLAGEVWGCFGSGDLDPRTRLDRLAELLRSKTDVALLSRLGSGPALAAPDRGPAGPLPGAVRAGRDPQSGAAPRSVRQRRQPATSTSTFASPEPGGRQARRPGPQRGDDPGRRYRGRRLAPARRRGSAGDHRPDHRGVSLLVTQRSEFAAVIERSDMEGLLTELQARATSASDPDPRGRRASTA